MPARSRSTMRWRYRRSNSMLAQQQQGVVRRAAQPHRDQMRALAAKDGVCQITLYNGFLRTDGKACINDAMLHLEHAINVMGIDHVGLGTDFDGDGGVARTCRRLRTDKLHKRAAAPPLFGRRYGEDMGRQLAKSARSKQKVIASIKVFLQKHTTLILNIEYGAWMCLYGNIQITVQTQSMLKHHTMQV